MKNLNLCPCGSGEQYRHCCQIFHKGKWPENALLLMRSRYTAYVLNLPHYIIQTTHPKNPSYLEDQVAWQQDVSAFSLQSTFYRLEIHDFNEKENTATVTFTAYLAQSGHNLTFTEKSEFEKTDGKWLYRDGQTAQGRVPNLS